MDATTQTSRLRRAGAHRVAVAGAVSALLVLTSWAPAARADEATKAFKPVHRTPRALIFRPQRVESQAVVRAKVTYKVSRPNSKQAVERTRGVSVRRVRRALEHGRRLKVGKPRRARGGRLIVHATGRGGPSAQTSCTFGTFGSTNFPGACWRPFADTSPWNRGVGPAPAQRQDSSAIVETVTGFGPPDNQALGAAEDWSHPVYFSQPSDPVYTVHCTQSWGTCEVEGAQVRIPGAARPASGGDGHLAVIDQAAGVEYDFWQVQSKPAGGGTLTVSWGGKTEIGTANADGLGSNATAAHFALLAGVIRPAELEAGRIEHALTMTVKCTNGTYVWPATGPGAGRPCSSIGLSNDGAPAMGQHFVLGMSEQEIDALSVPDWQKTILRAMARYGMFVGDTGGNSWGFQFESSASYTSFGHLDPWKRLGEAWGMPTWHGATVVSMREGIDWSRLEVVDACVSRGTC
jgi:hypothetical protein